MEPPKEMHDTVIKVWRMIATDEQCEACSRQARYVVYTPDDGQHLCHSHTLNALRDAARDLSNVRYAAQT